MRSLESERSLIYREARRAEARCIPSLSGYRSRPNCAGLMLFEIMGKYTREICYIDSSFHLFNSSWLQDDFQARLKSSALPRALARGKKPGKIRGFQPKTHGYKWAKARIPLAPIVHDLKVVAIPEKKVLQNPFGGALCHRLKLDLTYSLPHLLAQFL